MAERDFAIRFSHKGLEQVRTALKGMGADGAAGLRQIEAASTKTTPAMRAVDRATSDLRQEFDRFAERIPIVGSALVALGPAGTAVAAAFAGVALGAVGLSNASRRAIEDLGELKDAADDVALSVEDLQSIRGVALMEGVGSGAVDAMLANLAINSARSSEGFGRMHAALTKVNPELAQQLALSVSQSERLDILARAIQGAASYNDKLNISVAAFGTEGRQMIRVLDDSGASMETWRERAMAAGLVIDEGLVKAVDAMGDRLAVLEAQTNVAAQRLAVAAAPIVEASAEYGANAMTGFALILENLKPIQQREAYALRALANELQRNLAAEGDFLDLRKNQLQEIVEELERRKSLGVESFLDEQLEGDRARREALWKSQDKLDEEAAKARAEARRKAAKAAEEAEREAEAAARLRAQQEREAIEIRASLGDWTGKLGAEEARLNGLVKARLLSQEAATAALKRYRAELDGSAAAAERWNAVIDETQTPLQRARAKLADFNAEVAKFGNMGVNTFAVRWGLTAEIEAARRAAEEATPEFQAVAEARTAIARAAEESLSIEERVAREWERQTALVGKYGYTMDEATAKVAAYRAELERQAESQRNSSFEIRFAAETLGAIFDEELESIEDLGRVATRVFREMAIEWLLANQKMAAGQSFMQFIGQAIGSFIGGGGFTPGADPALAAYPGTLNADPSIAAYGIHHAGGVIGSTPVPHRFAASSIFLNAPRFHRGGELGPRERAIIAEDGERMFSRVDNARIVRAVENAERGGAGGNLTVNIINQAGVQVEQRERRGANGSRELDVTLTRKVAEVIGSGGADRAMSARFGVRPQVAG